MSMKDFKVAQIVPVSCLHMIRDNHYHMCLAHLVEASEEYTKFYRSMSEHGKYVLMDNGAAENSQLGVDELLAMYDKVKPTEIVVPDTLCDMEDTLGKMDSFVSEHGERLSYKFMVVPQGKTVDEWKACAYQMLKCKRINTIGISKFLNIVTGDPMARLKAAEFVYEQCCKMGLDKVEIHLLGCDEGPGIVRNIRAHVPIVRGCDSAFAYIAAQAGVSIDARTTRPAGEIDFLNGKPVDGLSQRLSEMEWAAGVVDNQWSSYWVDTTSDR